MLLVSYGRDGYNCLLQLGICRISNLASIERGICKRMKKTQKNIKIPPYKLEFVFIIVILQLI
ncbi:hypothetical protein B2K_19035 [Paenibacillus mucilaginosus K02]|uniref:Uncharacterized protein n=1 Tax=Paenibacillus mucilaginosus K02 TaxID=997761 RepID=I0BK87_9BACL|nr:hypothetical protein B2K_19035 [Paenibacillus mucilaginosus K02]